MVEAAIMHATTTWTAVGKNDTAVARSYVDSRCTYNRMCHTVASEAGSVGTG